MVEIPDELHAVLSATIHDRNGEYVITLPETEVDTGPLAAGQTYRFAFFEAPETTAITPEATDDPATEDAATDDPPAPPVEQDEVREVTIEAIGEQGDGIAKVERGYVIIVPNAQPGEQPTVEITRVQQNVAFATVHKLDSSTT